MTVMDQADREALLREAIRETLEHTRRGDEDDDYFWRASLRSLIRSDRDRQILREETAPRQVEVDLHLTGPGVEGHRTSATALGALVQKISEATKFVARQLAGSSRWSENLQVEGFAPGSVRVVLRAPDVPRAPGAMVEDDGETADSKALRKVAVLLTLASSDDPGNDALVASIQDLPRGAREALRLAADVVVSAHWEIDGHVRRWREREEPLKVTRRGAEQLRDALAWKVPEPKRESFVGTLDGFRRSTGVAFLRPEGQGSAYAVAVSDPRLFHEVAQLAAYDDLPVRAVVETWQAHRSDGRPGSVSRRLAGLEALGMQDALEI